MTKCLALRREIECPSGEIGYRRTLGLRRSRIPLFSKELRLQAVVLVGGEGTRLRPLTLETPKPMVPIMNVPFLERTLLRLKAAGIDEVILPAGYLPAAISSHFGDGSRLGLSIDYVIEETPLGTAGAIKNVAQYIKGPFFVLNGDVLTSLDLRKMLEIHQHKQGMGVLHLIRVDDPSAFGCVVRDESGKVSAFVEKPRREEAPTNEVNAGTYLLEPAILDLIPDGRMVSIERETFPLVVAGSRPLYAYTTDDYWIDLGNPEAYMRAHRDVFEGTMPLGIAQGTSGPGAKDCQAAGCFSPVFIGKGVRIASGASVGPYVTLGDGCSIGVGASVRNSVLWDAVTVEEGAFIDGAIIASRARIGAHAVVKPGTVVGHDGVIRSGSELAENARVTAS
jgi:mannose-1-phosphate guanylyltransferase